MNVIKVLKAGCSFLTEFKSGDPMSAYDVREFLQSRYKFFEAPITLERMFAEEGGEFQYGEFREKAIRRLVIESSGFIAETGEDTTFTEELLRDVVGAIEKQFKMQISIEVVGYDSILEVQWDQDPLARYTEIQPIQNSMNDKIDQSHPGMGVLALSKIEFNSPVLEEDASTQLTFSLERRQGKLFAENIFYSRAPLKTDEHVQLLKAHFG
ncbi:hypothetical protein [uncultured Hyphomonas sp.]|uniref:hypothetical protein n=1 Tax=uncultured Hyphomonas sp. TaxID=225298 RepID=UPI002AAB059D|nr:hypothetical protein [uncultured Hyphomonas sp.]